MFLTPIQTMIVGAGIKHGLDAANEATATLRRIEEQNKETLKRIEQQNRRIEAQSSQILESTELQNQEITEPPVSNNPAHTITLSKVRTYNYRKT